MPCRVATREHPPRLVPPVFTASGAGRPLLQIWRPDALTVQDATVGTCVGITDIALVYPLAVLATRREAGIPMTAALRQVPYDASDRCSRTFGPALCG